MLRQFVLQPPNQLLAFVSLALPGALSIFPMLFTLGLPGLLMLLAEVGSRLPVFLLLFLSLPGLPLIKLAMGLLSLGLQPLRPLLHVLVFGGGLLVEAFA